MDESGIDDEEGEMGDRFLCRHTAKRCWQAPFSERVWTIDGTWTKKRKWTADAGHEGRFAEVKEAMYERPTPSWESTTETS